MLTASLLNLSLAAPAGQTQPKLTAFVEAARSNPAELAAELRDAFPITVASAMDVPSDSRLKAAAYPIVVTHGMGDSCFNPGMKSITKAAGAHSGVYSVCIPTGDTQSTYATIDKGDGAELRAGQSMSFLFPTY